MSMARELRSKLFRLSAAERLELIEELWESLDDMDKAPNLIPEQREDLDRRLAEADADPEGGSLWEQLQERIPQRRR